MAKLIMMFICHNLSAADMHACMHAGVCVHGHIHRYVVSKTSKIHLLS